MLSSSRRTELAPAFGRRTLASRRRDEPVTLRRAQPWLGTVVAISGEGDPKAVGPAIEAAFAAIAAVHAAMSFHDPASELRRLLHRAPCETQEVSSALYRVLRAAVALAKASGGRFDPTVAAKLVAAGRLPAPDGPPADPAADWRDIELLPGSRVRLRRRLLVDLGGIAKGYAVDVALRRLRRPGVSSGLVNAGGDLRSFGKEVTISVRDPAAPVRVTPTLGIRNAAVATSGGYFSDSSQASDLVDPETGASLGLRCSVTVVAPRAIWADALTKVVLADEPSAIPLLRRLGASALLLGDDGSRRRLA